MNILVILIALLVSVVVGLAREYDPQEILLRIQAPLPNQHHSHGGITVTV